MQPAFISFLFLAGLALTQADWPWVNEYDKPMTFNCPTGQVVMYMSSIYDNEYKDRIWEIYCRSVPASTTNCIKSDWINDWDKPVTLSCPRNRVVTGIESYHENHHEDRRFKYTCCSASNNTLSNCYMTDYMNGWGGKMTLFVPEGQAIRSVYSYHDNNKKDRRFSYEICTL